MKDRGTPRRLYIISNQLALFPRFGTAEQPGQPNYESHEIHEWGEQGQGEGGAGAKQEGRLSCPTMAWI